MRTWQRAVQPMPCGGPHDSLVTIPVGAPLLVITMDDVRALYRCELCAGEPVPVLPGAPPTPSGLTRITRPSLVRSLPFDVKQAQAGREPGADDV